MNHIYVDHAATTPIHPDVVETMLPYMQTHFGNPSSIHAVGRETRSALDQARRLIANQLGVEPGQLVFTSGGTEADNLAIIGVAMANQHKGKHIITSTIEHHAVLNTCKYLEEIGFEVTYLPVNSEGEIELGSLENALRKDTILVSIMYGNNEVGTLQPVREISQLLKERNIYFHSDAVQAFGIERIDLQEIPIDLLALSSHKINGPKGMGLLYLGKKVKMSPLLFGGSQERNRRAGTENTAGIVGFAKAVEIASREMDERRKAYLAYRQRILQILDQEGISYQLNGHQEKFLPHILNVSFAEMKADAMLMNLDLEGVAAASGSACSAGSLQPSHVILAMHGEEERAKSAIRFSFGLGNTLEQMEQVAYTVVKILQKRRV